MRTTEPFTAFLMAALLWLGLLLSMVSCTVYPSMLRAMVGIGFMLVGTIGLGFSALEVAVRSYHKDK